MAKSNEAKGAGCVVAALSTLVILPLWACILFGLLKASNAETWTWVLYWIYLPAALLFGVAKQIVESIVDE